MSRKRVAILCNGPSLGDHDLNKIDCETIGLNRSWELIRSTHHLMTDSNQWGMYTHLTGQPIDTLEGLITGQKGPGFVQIKCHQSHKPRWSANPLFGVYMCGTVTYAALQLAVHYFGYREIYMLGLDLAPRKASGKFWGGPWHPSIETRQRESLGYAAAILDRELGIDVWNVGSPNSKCAAFRHRTFGECFS